TDKKYLGVQPEQIVLLLGKADEQRKSKLATRENILDAFKWIAKNAEKNDLVVFAFFGQGGPVADRTCYFASNSTLKDRSKNAVGSAEIEEILEPMKSERFCAFIDVNFKGYTQGKEAIPEPSRAKLFSEFLGSDDDKDKDPEGRVVILATDGFTQSIDLKDSGLFAKVNIDGLKGAADKDGYESDGAVTVEELA